MNTTASPQAQVQKLPPRTFPQSPRYVSRNTSRETLAELVVEATERGWITRAAGGKALAAIDAGRFSAARAERLICAGAFDPKKRRAAFLQLLAQMGA